MIDLHTHILPGLDDGAEDLADSLGLAELALAGGVEMLVATPHSNQIGLFENYASQALEQVFQKFQMALAQEQLPLKVYLGMEIFASEHLAEKIRMGKLISLNRSRYYLVEFAFDEEPSMIRHYMEQIFAAGGVPLIAHPERYFCVQDYPALVYEWLRMGCFTQINKGSLFGRFGRHSAQTAEVLLQNRLVTCVASDAHSLHMRTTYMKDAQEYLIEQFGDDEMYRLVVENPGRIVRNWDIPEHGRSPEQKIQYYI